MDIRRPLLGRTLLLATGLAAMLAGCAREAARETKTAETQTAPAAVDTATITFTTVDGPGVLAAVKAGGAKVTLVNVWASWCQPCREEFPDLVRLSRELGPQGFRIVFVSADFTEDVPNAKTFLAEQGVGGPALLKTGDDMQFIDTLDPSWSGALPGSFLYDSGGRRIRSWEGKASYDSLRARILPALESASGA